MRSYYPILILFVLILAVLATVWFLLPSAPKIAQVNNFDECAEAGYPVMESYPRQCRTPDGQNFLENIQDTVSDLIVVDSPVPNALISSPLHISGQARGVWYFEASFPVKLLDANGSVLLEQPIQAQGDPDAAGGGVNWMTTDFVPFASTLNFSKPTTKTGVLVFSKDNPSGLPEYDAELRVPVVFQSPAFSTTTEN